MSLQSLAPHIWNIWQQGNYYHTIPLLLTAQSQQPTQLLYRYYLGLAYIFKNNIQSAHEVWQLNLESPEIIENLEVFLTTELTRLEDTGQWIFVLKLRQQIRDINPLNLDNQLYLILLLMQFKKLSSQDVSSLSKSLHINLELSEVKSSELGLNLDLLLNVIKRLFHYDPGLETLYPLVKTVAPWVPSRQDFQAMIKTSILHLAQNEKPGLACQYTQLYFELGHEGEPHDLGLIRDVLWFIVNCKREEESIDFANLLANHSDSFLDQLFSNTVILYASQKLGRKWNIVEKLLQQQTSLLKTLFESSDSYSPFKLLDQRFYISLFLAPYLYDHPEKHHKDRRQLGDFIQTSLGAYLKSSNITYQPTSHSLKSTTPVQMVSRSSKLRIGYIGASLRQHSVGWIARWLYRLHNHDEFEIYTYFHRHTQLQRFSKECFAQYSDVHRMINYEISPVDVAQQIQRDRIDILVDIDSYTGSPTYAVMALKPAPIQVTWLGWDASGLSTIDYFIADPYVLPKDAQKYYTEKIWRLPQTYLAVQGFEVDFPTRKRADLDIPDDAIVYFSNQHALKRQDDFIRVQMQVLKKVPNSYFLIKAMGNLDALQTYFGELAEEEGISCDRLRFLPLAPTESLYRGNLTLADVVLDSYPYNGATTTLETLWVGIPLVTRVGQQFQARNSYTMLKNAGIDEGIAWTDEEYIDWAVRLGIDEALRKQVVEKLRKSRQTSPLWDSRRFTREMEQAYQQMWALHTETIP